MFVNWIIDILQDNSNLLTAIATLPTAIAAVATLSEKAYDLCSSALDFKKRNTLKAKVFLF
jgi:hypothetical protein